MFIIIKDNSKYKTINLSQEDIRYKGIHFFKKNNIYYIELNNSLYFKDGSKLQKLTLNKYDIVSENRYYHIEIYVYKDNKGYDDYILYNHSNFIISNNNKADIVSLDKYIEDKYLILKDKKLISNYDISVNGYKYNGSSLVDGDIVEFIGFRFIYNSSYLYMNNFNIQNKLRHYTIHKHIICYNDIKLEPYYYLPKKDIELKIEDIKPFNYSQEFKTINTRTIISSTFMSLTMVVVSIINYINALYNDRDLLSRLVILIMPIGMIFTTTIMPIIFYYLDKRNDTKQYQKKKDEYINYLNEYDRQLDSDINLYLESMNSHYFDVLDAERNLFYAKNNSLDYLRLSLGKTIFNKEINIPYTEDIDIDKKLKQIKEKLNINDIPLFISILENRYITIVSKKIDKQYYLYRFVLELAYKHHFDDLYIGIYTKDENIYESFFNLPHMFFNKNRLSPLSYSQLQWLDCNRYDKPLVLFMYDEIDYTFTNKMIYIIDFTDDRNYRYKLSDVIVDYSYNKAILYNKESIQFDYYQHDIDFKSYYNYLGRFYNNKPYSEVFRFSDFIDLETIIKNYRRKPVGLKAEFAYYNDSILEFDLCESKHGPHGLIGGSTGSGKSELIISMLLSLCLRYPPDYLNIVLIDYKGAGILESLSFNNKVVPHIVGSISNLDGGVLDRLIIRLQKICIERQLLFKRLSRDIGKSIMNIDDYLNLRKDDYPKCAHLLIVVDEFAQLKKSSPETIKELISLSRIGRSLGLHLILSTQKPAGNIDDEIWSNSRFKIALKVYEQKDSMDIIKDASASYLSQAGSFVLRVDDNLLKAQCIYSKNDIYGKDPYEVKVLDNILDITDSHTLYNENIVTEISYYIKNIISICHKLNIESEKIDFLPIEAISNKTINHPMKYHLGIVDDYINCESYDLEYDIRENILICSTRINEINNLINSLNKNQIKTTIIGNKGYRNGYISDSLSYSQIDDITFLFNDILYSNPDICIVIEDINILFSYDDSFIDLFNKVIRRSVNSNFNIIVFTKDFNISYKIINSFSNRVLIEINDEAAISYFFFNRCSYVGNSFFFDNKIISFVADKIEEIDILDFSIDEYIRYIPELIKGDYKNNRCFVGYDINTREEIYVDKGTCVYSYDEELINRYKEIYEGKLECIVYDDRNNKRINNLIWLGSGLFNQRLFMSNISFDLDNNHGLYINGNKRIIMRIINE